MKDCDSIEACLCNVIEVVNQIRKYSDKLSEQKVVEKFLRSFSKRYDHMVVALEESEDLSVFIIDELLASLKSHKDKING